MAHEELTALGTEVPRHWKRVIIAVWSGQAVSLFTSIAAGFALVWYLTETTGSAFILALSTLMYFIPAIVIGPFAGTIIDRHNRKHIMIIADLGIAAVTLVMAALIALGLTSVPLVLGMLLARSVGMTFHQPAMQAVMPLLVPDRHLVRINTLDQGLAALGNIGGPPIGIVMYTLIGLQAALVADAIGALIACTILAFVSIPDIHLAKEERTGVRSEMMDGLRAIRGRRGMVTFVALVFVCIIFFMPMSSFFPLMTLEHFGGDGYAASIAEVAWGIGFLLGSIILGIWGGGRRLVELIAVSVVICGLITLACGLLPSSGFLWFVLLTGVMALTGAFFNSPMLAILQRNFPAEKLGRVMALFSVVTSLAGPVGLLATGPVADVIGVPRLFVISGVGMALVALSGLFFPSLRSLNEPCRPAA
jgi:DHA3 family macrolide efflux protein-like MFS transporter